MYNKIRESYPEDYKCPEKQISIGRKLKYSFYSALIGPYLNKKTGVLFGIDYIDPWVHQFPGSEKLFSRHWLSTQLAKILEPIALTNVSLITGVAEGYYEGVIQRNPKLKSTCVFGAMPYGGEIEDHKTISILPLNPYLFKKNDKIQFVYAGAMLPKAYEPLQLLFEAINESPKVFKDVEFHFIGTGYNSNDSSSYNIKKHALNYGLWQTVIFEYPQRIPYLDVLVHLNCASAVFILGSTEPHYTPSKVYQGILAKKPIMAVLHKDSTATNIILESKAGFVLTFGGEIGLVEIKNQFSIYISEFKKLLETFRSEDIKMELFNQYSAKATTQQLVTYLNQITP